MTQKAAEIYNRGRRSGISSREAWERLKELSEETKWNTDWMALDLDSLSEAERRYEHE